MRIKSFFVALALALVLVQSKPQAAVVGYCNLAHWQALLAGSPNLETALFIWYYVFWCGIDPADLRPN